MRPTAVTPTSGETIRVVVADYHPLFREGVRGALETAGGFELVAEAGDGGEAIGAVASVRPSVLLLDMNLPDMSGIEVARRLREAESDVRTLLLAAAIDRSEILEALRSGVHGVVTKEATADLLVRAIRAVVRGEFWVDRQTMAEWTEYLRRKRIPRLTLSVRERQVIDRLLEGRSNRDIARLLSLGEETVKTHVSNVYRKLGVSNRVELALYVSSGKLRQPM
jgi:DNA-binding NarL/FixJ family response regulator